MFTLSRDSRKSATVNRLGQSGFTLVELLVVITIIGILIALLLPAVQTAREAARKIQCAANFKQVGLALHSYNSAKGYFPPSEFCHNTKGGAPMYFSWAIYIMPYLDQQAVYDMYCFNNVQSGYYHYYTEDDNLGRNRSASHTVINVYNCPSDDQSGEWIRCCTTSPQINDQVAYTSMAAVADSVDSTAGGYWPKNFPVNDGIFGANECCTLDNIQDGTSNTLMIGEVTGQGKGTFVGYFWASSNWADTAEGINAPMFSAPGGHFPDGSSGILPSEKPASRVGIRAGATSQWPTAVPISSRKTFRKPS
jgi:prepilin-type N-terminal cleavage/methylation domain-containing protein